MLSSVDLYFIYYCYLAFLVRYSTFILHFSVRISEPNAQVYSQMRKNFNQKCRFSHQTRKFVFETVEKVRKIAKNLEKCMEK
jgi:hypothetical protein